MLETNRLRLRAHRREDLQDCFAMWSDPAVTRHIGGKPFTREEVWTKLLRYAGLWSVIGFGYWVIEEAATGRFLGEAGLADFQRSLDPAMEGAPEVGWALAPWAHGKGYATEAVRAVLSWADSQLGVPKVVCIIDPGNEASLRVAEKTGFRQVRRLTYKGEPTILFERTRPTV
jgi:RimJ/RimL family protein N-acetyltransferase